MEPIPRSLNLSPPWGTSHQNRLVCIGGHPRRTRMKKRFKNDNVGYSVLKSFRQPVYCFRRINIEDSRTVVESVFFFNTFFESRLPFDSVRAWQIDKSSPSHPTPPQLDLPCWKIMTPGIFCVCFCALWTFCWTQLTFPTIISSNIRGSKTFCSKGMALFSTVRLKAGNCDYRQ